MTPHQQQIADLVRKYTHGLSANQIAMLLDKRPRSVSVMASKMADYGLLRREHVPLAKKRGGLTHYNIYKTAGV